MLDRALFYVYISFSIWPKVWIPKTGDQSTKDVD